MAGKKPSAVAEKLAKSGDTLDIQPAVDEAKAQLASDELEAKRIIEEINEVRNTPDMPKRWGAGGGKLTFATPGYMIQDPTYIPEYVELNNGGRRHVCNHRFIRGQFHLLSSDSTRKFRWCRLDSRKIPIHQRYGFQYVSYKKLFKDTSLFTEGPNDRVINGDMVLMEISMDGYERMNAERIRLQSQYEGTEGAELFSEAEAMGVHSFRDDEKRAVREYMT